MNLLENHSPAIADRANAIKMPRTRIIEIQQNHPIQLDMYPKGGWSNVKAAHELIDCSSNEMRIANSPRRAIANGNAMCLQCA